MFAQRCERSVFVEVASQTPMRSGKLYETEDVRTRIEEIGIFPGIRVKSADQALYAAETLYHAGIPVAEITMTVPGGIEVIRNWRKVFPTWLWAPEQCLIARPRSAVSTQEPHSSPAQGSFPKWSKRTQENVVAIPGALTPTEVIAAMEGGRGLCENISRRAGRRRSIHPLAEVAFASGKADRRRRRKSANRITLPLAWEWSYCRATPCKGARSIAFTNWRGDS
jgi:hypothetical protein